MPFVFSTLTCDNAYAGYKTVATENEIRHTIAKQVLIKGGHGVMNKHFITPLGTVTEVSDEDLDFLMANDHFKFHLDGGFLKVEKKKAECEKIAADMSLADGSAPMTPADYEKGGRAEGTKAPKA